MIRKSKIVATIGPACEKEEKLRELIQAGMNVARLNFSHGSHEEHAQRINTIRRLSDELNLPVAILQDLQGPKLRVGNVPEQGIELIKGSHVVLANSKLEQSIESKDPDMVFIPMDIPAFAESVVAGDRVLMDDGQLELKVVSVKDQVVEAEVILNGILKSHKGVNLPGAHVNIPGFTEKDRADLAFGLTQHVDMIAISFVSTAADITLVRDFIRANDPTQIDLPIIAKMERPAAIDNMDAIIHEADGVMVARGDLGVETSPSVVPIIQKRIIEEANKHGKLVITATQMLDSMIHNPRPTRAEASDVANAIFDGTDAVMLSGETAAGSYPVEAVSMMDAIVREAEANTRQWGHVPAATEEITSDDAASITRAARELAYDRNVANIAVFTQTGHTALLMSKTRPQVHILAFTPDVKIYQRMALYWGVTPFIVPYTNSVESMLEIIEHTIYASTSLQPGDQIVLVTGFPVGEMRPPNFALLHTIGKLD